MSVLGSEAKKVLCFFLLFVFFPVFWVEAQDERFIRKMYSGQLGKMAAEDENVAYKWKVQTPLYRYDLNGDGEKEGIQFEKRDGEDWLQLFDSTNQKFFEKKFEKLGLSSRIKKIRLVNLSKDSRILLIYYYEGLAQYLDLEGRERVYFLTFDYNKIERSIKNLHLFLGPHLRIEKSNYAQNFFRRSYDLKIQDLNQDGINEIFLTQGSLQKLYSYLGNGNWRVIE